MNTKNSERFIASFNRVNKWLVEKAGNPVNTSFVNLVNMLKKRPDLRLSPFASDLIQFAQLRNAIVHDQTGAGFVIAEPNDWAVERMEYIEETLSHPEKVLPRFRKKIVTVDVDLPVKELLRLVVSKRYTFYPVMRNKQFVGLITLHSLGLLLAEMAFKEEKLSGVVSDVLIEEKQARFRFIAGHTPIALATEYFQKNPMLDALIITRHGEASEELLGIIRANDLFQEKVVRRKK